MNWVNFLFVHSLIEILGVIVSVNIFILGWNTYRLTRNFTMELLGVGYLWVGFLDLIHTFAYKGMGIFPWATANLPTQLWISARYLETATLFLSALSLKVPPNTISPAITYPSPHAPPIHKGVTFSLSRIRPQVLLGIVHVIGLFILGAVFTGYFPDCFIEGKGLTTFKIGSEYLISTILLLTGIMLWSSRSALPRQILRYLLMAIGTTILSELTFTLYQDVYGLFNYLGHILKFFSILFVYQALIEQNLIDPIRFLLKEITYANETLQHEIQEKERKEEELKKQLKEKELLVQEVHHRIKNNLSALISLLSIQKDKSTIPETHILFEEAIAKLYVMETLYAKMVSTKEADSIQIDNYLEELVQIVLLIFPQSKQITVERTFDTFTIDSKAAFLLGVIINELLTNALKYAFQGRSTGTIHLSLKREGESCTLKVEDTGIGIEPSATKEGFGLELVRMLTNQLGGTFSISSERGTRCTVVFPLSKASS